MKGEIEIDDIVNLYCFVFMDENNTLVTYLCNYLSIGKPTPDTIEQIKPVIDIQKTLCDKGVIASFEEYKRFLNCGIKAFNKIQTMDNYIWLNEVIDIPIINGFAELPEDLLMNEIFKASFDRVSEKVKEIENGNFIIVDLCIIDKTRPNIILNY